MQQIVSRTRPVYALLIGVWCIIAAWQTAEHVRVRKSARAALINRSRDITTTLGLVIRSQRWGGGMVRQDRLESALKELVKSGELSSVALLNASGEIVVSAGPFGDFESKGLLQTSEHWEHNRVTLVNLVDLGASVTREGETNSRTIVLPPRPNPPPLSDHPLQPGERPPGPPPRFDETSLKPGETATNSSAAAHSATNSQPADSTNALLAASSNILTGNPTNLASGTNRLARPPRNRRPPWMSEQEYKSLLETRGLHGLAISMSTANYHRACGQDLWMRLIIGCFAAISVVGLALAWRNLGKSSELELRLLRASELNTHLKQMNLAAAGLAHETRNPLNIIRGLAQMISKQQEASSEVRAKSSEIVNEADRVTAQLNEFINFSRPREVRRSAVALGAVIREVVRALKYDVEEKKIGLDISGDQLVVEADEQLLRQALFNLLLNGIQAVDPGGMIQIAGNKQGASEASLEIRDNGPGVAPSQRSEIFKPYVTTHEKGTGLGLVVVQQIVLAHGWEIECLSNEPKGAVFRITHLKLVSKS